MLPSSLKAAVNLPPHTINTMDKAAFPSFEIDSQRPFVELMPALDPAALDVGLSMYLKMQANVVQDRWLVRELRLARLWDLLRHGDSPIDSLQLQASADDSDSLQPDDWEVCRQLTVQALQELYDYYLPTIPGARSDAKKHLFDDIENLLAVNLIREFPYKRGKSIASLLLSPTLILPTWKTFHDQYTVLELCQVITITLNHVLVENRKKMLFEYSWLQSKVRSIQDQCKVISEAVYEAARILQDDMRDSTASQEFSQKILGHADNEECGDLVGNELRGLNTGANVGKVCKDLQMSWVEGLAGLIKTNFE